MSQSRKIVSLEEACDSIVSIGINEELPFTAGKVSRIMYIECKAGELSGDAIIGRVTFSKTSKTLYYGDKKFQSLKGAGFKSNYCEVFTGDDYWISGPKKDGNDRLYSERVPVLIDEDCREEYWKNIRNRPDLINQSNT
ncbi:MAG: 1-deoxy-D-xylulose-5-phosphate synthase [Akkermansiaceae bacterium]